MEHFWNALDAVKRFTADPLGVSDAEIARVEDQQRAMKRAVGLPDDSDDEDAFVAGERLLDPAQMPGVGRLMQRGEAKKDEADEYEAMGEAARPSSVAADAHAIDVLVREEAAEAIAGAPAIGAFDAPQYHLKILSDADRDAITVGIPLEDAGEIRKEIENLAVLEPREVDMLTKALSQNSEALEAFNKLIDPAEHGVKVDDVKKELANLVYIGAMSGDEFFNLNVALNKIAGRAHGR